MLRGRKWKSFIARIVEKDRGERREKPQKAQ
jgi:hypothetical protein